MLTDLFKQMGVDWDQKHIANINENVALSYLYSKDGNKFLAARISCVSIHSDYCYYELDAVNWGKALTDIFEATSINDVVAVSKVFSSLKFSFNIEGLFKEKGVRYHKCVSYGA